MATKERNRGKAKDTVIDQTRWAILVAEYDHENNPKTLDSYGPHSNKPVQWICPEKGHRYPAIIHNRYKGTRCSFCYGKAVGTDNCLAATNPELASQWHPTLNNKTPYEIKAGSNTKYWWICEKGHVWDAEPNSRKKGHNCRHCAGRTTADGNTLAAKFPELVAEWSSKNALKPDQVTPKTNDKVWWNCPKGHEYESSISNRSSGSGCTFCSGKAVCNDTSFAFHYSELAKEWHPTKNEHGPDTFSRCSGEPVWWKCEKGHEWPQSISNRVKGCGCGYCSGRYPTPENNLAVCHPHLVKEWHPTKNAKSPYEYTPGAHQEAWWVCSKNPSHEWPALINNRTCGNKSNCPTCNKSKLELATHNALTKLGAEFKSEYVFADFKQYRYDFKVGVWNTLIECDGEQHFINNSKFYSARVRGKNFEEQQESDRIKTKYAIDNGYTIIRIAYTELSRIEEILTEFMQKQLWLASEKKVYLFPEEAYTWLFATEAERILAEINEGFKEYLETQIHEPGIGDEEYDSDEEVSNLKSENESLKAQIEALKAQMAAQPSNIISHV